MSWTTSLFLATLVFFVALANADLRRNVTEAAIDEKIPTDQWAVKLLPTADPDEVARRHGFINRGHLFGNYYRFEKSSIYSRDVHPPLKRSSEVLWDKNQLARQRYVRNSVSDPLYNSQWHLHNTPAADINVEPVWALGITGQGVTIGIVDDGLQHSHPDIQPQYCAECSIDINHNDMDPEPTSYYDDHGTESAGVAAAAANNGICGSGAAYGAKLAGIQLISAATTDSQEAQAMSYKGQLIDVYSCSWGPNDDGRRLDGPGELTMQSLENGVTTGRQGKGSIYMWAGGNGRGSGDNCNYDGYANNRFTTPVGAIGSDGHQAYYSESCAALFVCTASSDGSKQISTVTLKGRGSGGSDCTGSFGGTSSASPLGAGVVALMLQANPNLSWRDVRHILAKHSDKTSANDPDWTALNQNGISHSHKYGFGKMNALSYVQAAQNWTSVPEEQFVTTDVLEGHGIQDLGVELFQVEITEGLSFIEHIDIYVDIQRYSNRGTLQISLISPSGVISKLQEQHRDSGKDIVWRFGSVRHWGEELTVGSVWTLKIADAVTDTIVSKLNFWRLDFFGY